MKQIRQGDILLEPRRMSGLRKKFLWVNRSWTRSSEEAGRIAITLAYGEKTGHKHDAVVEDPNDIILWERQLTNGNRERLLEVRKDAKLTHEDHGVTDLPKGLYDVTDQREYQPQGRPVPRARVD